MPTYLQLNPLDEALKEACKDLAKACSNPNISCPFDNIKACPIGYVCSSVSWHHWYYHYLQTHSTPSTEEYL